ncbi:winged helix DNA-binding protein [Qipengyuania soli]|uniref:Winged helix DNA-binding protein n=1 Tax=Qipengyuania soli TaxID=2782568 RepID=A0A7S8IUA5_9SPHN|nr:winged helix DNA-binding protein [Qipengyuania soli]QPC98145.1 winged helix DNA-binding protein [Qipengyuania soli]
MKKENVAELRDLATRILGLTEEQGATIELYRQDAKPIQAIQYSTDLIGDDELWRAARKELARKRARTEFLPAEMSTGACWTMLLDLFDNKRRHKQVSITSVCSAAMVPTTTALRYLGLLFTMGLVERLSDPRDARRVHVRLTGQGETAVKQTLQRQIEVERRIDEEDLKENNSRG